MIWHLLFTIAASIIFLYLLWRILSTEYSEKVILSYGWLALIFFIAGSRLLFITLGQGSSWSDQWINWILVWRYPGLNYWGGIGALLIWTYAFTSINKLKTWGFFEDVLVILDIFLLIKFFGDLITGAFGISLVGWWLLGCVVLMAHLIIREKYRSFVWYKSGKKGFAFFFSISLFSLLSALFLYFMDESIIYILLMIFLGILSLSSLLILGDIIQPLPVKIKRKKNG